MLKEINGYTVADGKLVSGFTELKDDGSTACGCWIYSGCYADGVNQPARRKPGREQTWVASEWGWAWPANRRMLYNRASADPEGRPWSERKKYVWWDAEKGEWTGDDVPDFIKDRPPSYRADTGDQGLDVISGDDPFIMQADGKGWLFAPSGMMDGPLPTHYEPLESPVRNFLYGQQCNPARFECRREDNPYHRRVGRPALPLRAHHVPAHRAPHRGRHDPLAVVAERAAAGDVLRGLSGAGRRGGAGERGLVHLSTARGELECRVLVTERIRPLRLDGKRVHQIGLPYHWGYTGPRARGGSANDLHPLLGGPERVHPGVQGAHRQHRPREARPGPARGHGAGSRGRCHPVPQRACGAASRPQRPAPNHSRSTGKPSHEQGATGQKGFFTDTTSASAARPARWPASSGTSCPTTASSFTGMSYDNTGHLGASTWRHVAFVERPVPHARR